MSKGQTLRALVNERLNAAAEEIFVLVERTIAEYEEELSRSKEENRRKQQRLDSILLPRIVLVRGGVQMPSTSPGPSLTTSEEITKTPRIKDEPEEQSVKREEEELPVPAPESSAACVSSIESLFLQQEQTEHREDTKEEDISPEPHFHSQAEGNTDYSADTDHDDDLEPPFTSLAAQIETLAVPNKSVPETRGSVNNGGTPKTDKRGNEKKKQCLVCKKTFSRKYGLKLHMRLHTGERPYSCSICEERFSLRDSFTVHMRTHTGEKPYSCSICKKAFTRPCTLASHKRIHAGDRPFRCLTCDKRFSFSSKLKMHMRTHTGEKPYSCSICKRAFTRQDTLDSHSRTHTGEKPFSCLVCPKRFSESCHLKVHMRTHTGERPYSCSYCDKAFKVSASLKSHMRRHPGGKSVGEHMGNSHKKSAKNTTEK